MQRTPTAKAKRGAPVSTRLAHRYATEKKTHPVSYRGVEPLDGSSSTITTAPERHETTQGVLLGRGSFTFASLTDDDDENWVGSGIAEPSLGHGSLCGRFLRRGREKTSAR